MVNEMSSMLRMKCCCCHCKKISDGLAGGDVWSLRL